MKKERKSIYQKSVIAAFGRERALEIFKAARHKSYKILRI
jgi:hypothetical protein